MADPQPAELTTIASTPASSNTEIVAFASRSACAERPACSDSAPQHPWSRGMITSQPSAASTRAVAAFTPGKNTDCTHPVSMPDYRPAGAARGHAGGAPPVAAARRRGQPAGRLVPLATPGRQPGCAPASRSRPVRCATRSSGAGGIRSRRGYGNTEKIAARVIRRSGAVHPDWGRDGGRVLGPGPGRLDQHVVVNAGRARRHARHAAQAAIEVRPARPSAARPQETW